jgi:hypothetical protein
MNRIERWDRGSFATVRFEQVMCITIQSLGRIDDSLIEGDELFLADFENTRNSLSENLKLHDRFTLSYLWVLGSYEVVRTICQRIEENRNGIPDEIVAKFKSLKNEFNRLRVPLAKMEAASAHKNTDTHFAYPAINTRVGIVWQVSPDVFITRRDLSDQLLETLEFFRSIDPNLNNLEMPCA